MIKFKILLKLKQKVVFKLFWNKCKMEKYRQGYLSDNAANYTKNRVRRERERIKEM